MYGLETIALNPSAQSTIDAFHMKRLSKIMNIPSTYLPEHRPFTNAYALEQIIMHFVRTKKGPY